MTHVGQGHVEQHPHMGIVESVVRAPARPPNVHDLKRPEQAQSVTDRRLRLPSSRG